MYNIRHYCILWHNSNVYILLKLKKTYIKIPKIIYTFNGIVYINNSHNF